MTMRLSLGILAFSTAFLACSGRYYEVGDTGDTGATAGTGANGGSAAKGGRAATGGDEPSNAVAGTPAVGSTGSGSGSGMSAGEGMPLSEFGPQCVPSGAPPQLAGPFAEPAVIWQRVAMLTWGAPVAPQFGLPDATTYAWAGDVARAALLDTQDTLGEVPGVETFLRQWLWLPATASFQHAWSESVVTDDPVLSELLLQPLADEGRVGIFTEPAWLANRQSISTRGATIEGALFNVLLPAPPESIEIPSPKPNLTERALLESATMDPACAACHALFEASGFALGRFAADGMYRELDNGMPIDTYGVRSSGTPPVVREFDGIEDFGRQFAGACESNLGFADQFLLAAMEINGVPHAQREPLYEASRARVERAFVDGGRTYEAIVKAYIQSPAGLRP
jgi:Protein of unknown function (DUF1588)